MTLKFKIIFINFQFYVLNIIIIIQITQFIVSKHTHNSIIIYIINETKTVACQNCIFDISLYTYLIINLRHSILSYT